MGLRVQNQARRSAFWHPVSCSHVYASSGILSVEPAWTINIDQSRKLLAAFCHSGPETSEDRYYRNGVNVMHVAGFGRRQDFEPVSGSKGKGSLFPGHSAVASCPPNLVKQKQTHDSLGCGYTVVIHGRLFISPFH